MDAISRDKLGDDGEKVEISDLTWEQKEQVLRLLFAKMNTSTSKSATPSSQPLPPIQPSPNAPVFMTQTSVTSKPIPMLIPGQVAGGVS